MIIDLPGTTTNEVNKRLVALRDEGGAVALGRVLTLVISAADDPETAIDAANDASREHPCRVIVLTRGPQDQPARLDAQIRVGGDAGASEVVSLTLAGELGDHASSAVIPLLLPDAPIVAWWQGRIPEDPDADPIGAMAQRRITDSAACTDPEAALQSLRKNYREGDTDLAWTRVTLWRAILAASLEQPPYEPVREAEVVGDPTTPSATLLAAWLARFLKCPVELVRRDDVEGVGRVELKRSSDSIVLDRPAGAVATLRQPGQPVRHIALPHRELRDCLSEELRRLDPDEIYGEVLVKGLPKVVTA